MRKPICYLVATLLSLAVVLSGCVSQMTPKTDKQTLDPNNSAVQEAMAQTTVYKRAEVISSPDEAKQLLMDGNERFTASKPLSKDLSFTKRSDLLKNGQHPFAVIVSCSDSRVSPELLFDQALGDLFVVRVAGNVVTPVELGSVEYAVDHLKVPLVVVLGHEGCGAVTAAVEGGEPHGSIGAIIGKIKPAVDDARAMGTTGKELIEASTDLNIQNALKDLLKSPIIKERVNAKEVEVLGIKYDLDKGTLEVTH
ncbi:carbonic anhydrase [Desulfosporosinus sp. BICA1-9]|uniref:carbonic anhydrase n=1 Tax=Desulfosporosinus sp. BICA1-9 TaxID=1531958 RepID=UPI00054B3747|nr:carbonic anhydrase [Desulfosporosinus sp. BICA1-9]KJS77841.1 MAG: carbonic anhydrase [Desulfosporosinus sp. BICA1-9]